MGKIIYYLNLILLGVCFLTTSSCDTSRTLLSLDKEDSSDQMSERREEPSQTEEYPAVYLKRKNKFIDISTFNRRNLYLTPVDQIVFVDNKAEASIRPLKNLEEFDHVETLKVRISSFCSLAEDKRTKKDGKGRFVEEFGSQTYHSFFSIAEILPKKVLFSDLGRVYCGFIFTIKNKESGHLSYYNITQQAVEIQGSYSLELVKKAQSGDYFPYNRRLIKPRNIHSMYLLNNTQQLTENYILMCEGLKNISIPSHGLNILPIFTNLMTYDLIDEDHIKEEIQKCRFASEQNGKITGVAPLFELDFNDLYNQIQDIDLTKIERPGLFKQQEIFYSKGSKVPLNTHFYFPNLDKISKSEKDYSSVDVVVSAKCYDHNQEQKYNLFDVGQIVSKNTNLALRERIPLMAVTPEKIFQIGGITHKLIEVKGTDITLEIHCIYQVSLRDRSKPHNQVHFEDQHYTIAWSGASYGVDYIPIGGEQLFMNHNENQLPSVNPLKFYYQDTGYLNLNFFDIVGSKVFWSYDLDKISVECYEGVKQDKGQGVRDSVKISIPYNNSGHFLSIKSLFSHLDLEYYIKRKKTSFCRIMFYEEDILRYFSGEMKIVNNSVEARK